LNGWVDYPALVAQGRNVLFEGLSRFAFLVEAVERAGLMPYACILIDCDDKTRTRRFSIDRGQPELASADMMNWASFLRNEASQYGCEILDTSNLTLEQGVERVIREVRRHV
jgi:hypothetical protein